jgi:hypothetical protein
LFFKLYKLTDLGLCGCLAALAPSDKSHHGKTCAIKRQSGRKWNSGNLD